MNKTDIVKMVARRAGVSEDTALRVIDGVTSVIELSVACGEEVWLRGFGRFKPQDIPAQRRPVPVERGTRKTVVIDIPARRTLAFVPAQSLKERIRDRVGE